MDTSRRSCSRFFSMSAACSALAVQLLGTHPPPHLPLPRLQLAAGRSRRGDKGRHGDGCWRRGCSGGGSGDGSGGWSGGWSGGSAGSSWPGGGVHAAGTRCDVRAQLSGGGTLPLGLLERLLQPRLEHHLTCCHLGLADRRLCVRPDRTGLNQADGKVMSSQVESSRVESSRVKSSQEWSS